jgi:hypothetical protein
MEQIRKFPSLSLADQILLLKSAFLLGMITLGLRGLSFQAMQRFSMGTRQRTARAHHTDQPSANRIAWAVSVASRYVPAATCLPQALAVRMLFKQQGYPARLYIGVAKGERGQLEAHAWVESEGRIVVGNSQDLSRYTPLPSLEVESA